MLGGGMKFQSDFDLVSLIKTKHRAEDSEGIKGNWQGKANSGGGFPPVVFIWLHDLWLTAEELCTRLHWTGGTQDPSWDKDKKKTPKEKTRTRPSTTGTAAFSCFIPSSPHSSHAPRASFLWLIKTQHQWSFRVSVEETEEGDTTNLPPFFHLALIFSSLRCRFFHLTPSGLQMRPP